MQIISRSEAKQQNLKHYFTGKSCKHGHDSERYVNDGKCCECVKLRVNIQRKLNPEKKKKSNREYYVKNRTLEIEKAKIYRDENREEINSKRRKYAKSEKGKLARKVYVDDNRERINSVKVEYYHSNIESHREQRRNDHAKHRESRNAKSKEYREQNKDKVNEYFVNRRANDLEFKINAYMRNMIGRVLSRSYEDKTNSTVKMLGYNCHELISHLEGLFVDGMSWDNYGEWHIDHIVPLSKMIEAGYTSPELVNGLWNLQPLWALDNLIKSNKI